MESISYSIYSKKVGRKKRKEYIVREDEILNGPNHFADASKMINGDKTTLEKVQEHILSKRTQAAIAVLPITAAKFGPAEAAKEAVKYADALINEFFKECTDSINEELFEKFYDEYIINKVQRKP